MPKINRCKRGQYGAKMSKSTYQKIGKKLGRRSVSTASQSAVVETTLYEELIV